jgi:rRNA maturation endonuclease Nob1
MDIVVNDTNIFIDLYSVGLIDAFFNLPFEVHTVDFVVNEIEDEQQSLLVNRLIDNGRLTVHSFAAEELLEVLELQANAGGNVSVTDCAVWQYAKQRDYVLLTGDRQLRNKAIESNVTVKGILYVFDQLVECSILPPKDAATKLKELMAINVRLPKGLIQERIVKWESL